MGNTLQEVVQKNPDILIDPEDYVKFLFKTVYLSAKNGGVYLVVYENKKQTPLANKILDTTMLVDHKNRNTLDNRKQNLRPVTTAQNNANRAANKNSGSGFKGVSWSKVAKRWDVRVNCQHYGYYSCKYKAASVYNRVAKRNQGENYYHNYLPLIQVENCNETI